jgi:hypothetical protein
MCHFATGADVDAAGREKGPPLMERRSRTMSAVGFSDRFDFYILLILSVVISGQTVDRPKPAFVRCCPKADIELRIQGSIWLAAYGSTP